MLRSFIVFCYANSGSSWLLGTLGGSPQVLLPAFEPLEGWAWSASDDEKLDWMQRVFSPPADRSEANMRSWLDELSVNPQLIDLRDDERAFQVVGFKMSESAVGDHGRLLDLPSRFSTRVIVLSRRNRVKHALSLYRYHEEGKSQFQGRGARPPSKLDLRRFHRWLLESERLHGRMLSFGSQVEQRIAWDRRMALDYEEFVKAEDKNRSIAKLCDFLDIDADRLRTDRYASSGFEKATPDDLRRAVLNYPLLYWRYRFTRFRTYFRE